MLKVGDKVRVIENLEDRLYEGETASVVDEMVQYAGQEAEITLDDGDDTYLIDIDNGEWYWEEWMFKSVED